MTEIAWGPTGQAVYERTYSRVKPDGSRERWPDTVERVTVGNLALVHGTDVESWPSSALAEAEALYEAMLNFQILPAGRHLWASGVPGRQYLFNCHVAGWETIATHVEFVLMRLAEGGGVGANYSTRYLAPLSGPRSPVCVHVVCSPDHPDYDALRASSALSEAFDADWPGAFEVEDTREGWAAAVVELLESAWRSDLKHTDRVFDVSRIRGKGARLKTMGGTASGPLPLAVALTKIADVLNVALARLWNSKSGEPWCLSPVEAMSIDHAIAEAIVAGGNRRSARMSIVRWDDPFIFDFINCKSDPAEHWSTNISVEIDDEFIGLVDKGYAGQMYGEFGTFSRGARALAVYEAVVEGMLTNGEPGFWNSSLSNVGEPNPVVATNPCGEIALEPWENCNLGHVNMDAFVDELGVDMPGLERAHRLITRFLMRATYGDVVDDKQRATLARNRRIGVGHFGVQGFLVKQGIKFSEATTYESHATERNEFKDDLRHLALIVDKAAIEYAHELRIPVPVKKRTVAPTGTIAKMPGRTEGIHPIYARHFLRRVRYSNSDPMQRAQVLSLEAQGFHVEPDMYAAATDVVTFLTEEQLVSEVRAMGFDSEIVESADEISLAAMLAFQAFYQEHWADNAVSFTVNVPAEPHQLAAMLKGQETIPSPSVTRIRAVAKTLLPFLPRLKGTTMMLDGSRPQAPYERISESDFYLRKHFGATVTTDAGYDEECASGACPIK